MKNFKEFSNWLIVKYNLDTSIFIFDKLEDRISNIPMDYERVQELFSESIFNRPFTHYFQKTLLSGNWIGVQLRIDNNLFKEVLSDIIDYHANLLSDNELEQLSEFKEEKRDDFSILNDENNLVYLIGHKLNHAYFIDIATRLDEFI